MGRFKSSRKGKKRFNNKFKSGLEFDFAKKAKKQLLPFEYEPDRFAYVIQSHYLPDFKIRKDCYIETKGYFSSSNRSRMIAFKEQYPQVTIYLVFQKPENKINKNSETTYAEWAAKHGFEWSGINKHLPKHWWFPSDKEKPS